MFVLTIDCIFIKVKYHSIFSNRVNIGLNTYGLVMCWFYMYVSYEYIHRSVKYADNT